MKKEFKIKENGFSEIKPSILRIIPLLALPLIAGLAIKSKGFTTKTDILVIAVPIVVGIFVFAVFIGIKRAKKQFESFKLIITENEIIRKQIYVRIKEITIPINEVESVTKNKKGGITIKGKSNSNDIYS